jgi:hypothetical protein
MCKKNIYFRYVLLFSDGTSVREVGEMVILVIIGNIISAGVKVIGTDIMLVLLTSITK